MDSTLTVRTDGALRASLEKRAQAQGMTVSELVRSILQEAVSEKPVGDRAGHLKGRLDLPTPDTDPWREQIRQRNWRR